MGYQISNKTLKSANELITIFVTTVSSPPNCKNKLAVQTRSLIYNEHHGPPVTYIGRVKFNSSDGEIPAATLQATGPNSGNNTTAFN